MTKIIITDSKMAPRQQNSSQVLMNFQKQENYRQRKRKIENQRELEKKAARKERDRLRYLKKKESSAPD